jgi:hypothetical protein
LTIANGLRYRDHLRPTKEHDPMAIEPSRPESIGRVLDIAFQMYRASIFRVVPLTLASALVDFPASLYWLRLTGTLQTSGDPREVLSDEAQWAILLLSWIIKLWLLSALFLQVNAIATERQLTTGGALRQAARPVASMFVATILYLIALALAFLVGLFVFSMAALSGSFLVMFVFSFVASAPVLLFAISLTFAGPMVLLAAKGPFSALTASHSLVMGAWWRTTTILTVGSIVLFVIYSGAFSIIVGLYAAFPTWVLFEKAATLALTTVLTLLMTPLVVSLLLAAFRELQLRKQGGDLLGRVATLV